MSETDAWATYSEDQSHEQVTDVIWSMMDKGVTKSDMQDFVNNVIETWEPL